MAAKLVLLIRTDLGMSRGKIAVQAAHAAVAAALAAGLPVEIIRDAGRTQLAPGTPTCCAIGPAENSRVDAVTGRLQLL